MGSGSATHSPISLPSSKQQAGPVQLQKVGDRWAGSWWISATCPPASRIQPAASAGPVRFLGREVGCPTTIKLNRASSGPALLGFKDWRGGVWWNAHPFPLHSLKLKGAGSGCCFCSACWQAGRRDGDTVRGRWLCLCPCSLHPGHCPLCFPSRSTTSPSH